MHPLTPAHFILRHPLAFADRVLRHFHANRGVLLAGAVAYYALLSLVPLLILLLVALSHVADKAELLALLHHYLEQLVPGEAELVMAQVAQFLDQRRTLSWMMMVTLLFFSSLAFAILENTMAIIFAHRHTIHNGHVRISLMTATHFTGRWPVISAEGGTPVQGWWPGVGAQRRGLVSVTAPRWD